MLIFEFVLNSQFQQFYLVDCRNLKVEFWWYAAWKMRPVRRVSVINRNVNSATVNNGSNIRSTVFPEGMNLNYMRNFQSDSNYPKHISISYSSSDNFLIYETVVLLYSLSAFLLQLLHLYRTVWWLPQSYENNAMVCRKKQCLYYLKLIPIYNYFRNFIWSTHTLWGLFLPLSSQDGYGHAVVL